MAIGTVSRGRKKIAEGKWVDVKKVKTKFRSDDYEGGIKFTKDAHPDIVKEATEAMTVVQSKFPELEDLSLNWERKTNTNEYDAFDNQIKMHPNSAKHSHKEDLGYWSPTIDSFVNSPKTLIYHESGHALHHFLRRNSSDEVKDELFDLLKENIKEGPTAYAKTNKSELFAEVFTESLIKPKKDWSKATNEIMAYIDKISGRTQKSFISTITDPPAEYDHNYRLQGYRYCHGLKIAIENKRGSYRSGKDPNGKPWKVKMIADYGRIQGTKATDSEAVDVYVGPDDTATRVYVVHQQDPFRGVYDEDKVFLYYPSKESVIEAYLSQYNRPDFLGPISEFSIPDFKEALKERKGNMLYQSPIMLKTKIVVRRKK